MRTIEYISKTYSEKSSPMEAFGASSEAEYQKWFPHVCGICCLKMVGDSLELTNRFSLYDLTLQSVGYGVFKEKENSDEIEGAYHVPLIEFAKSLGISGKLERKLTISKIIELLNEGKFVVLSIDKSKCNPSLSGGHLILIYDFNQKTEHFLIHDSEPILAENGAAINLEKGKLEEVSNENGLSLWRDDSKTLLQKLNDIF